MRVYHVQKSAGPWDERAGLQRFLLAYDGSPRATVGEVLRLRQRGASVLLDSGAFGAWKSGRPRDLSKYIETCRVAAPIVDAYAALDVIGDWKGSESNYAAMRAAGLEPIPTFHTSEPLKALESMLADFTGYLGLGGLVGLHRNQRRLWLDDVWSRLVQHSRWPFKVHGWGVTDLELMSRYPWFSVDSSSVSAATRGGGAWVPPETHTQRVPTDLTQSGKHGIVRARAYREEMDRTVAFAEAKWRSLGIEWDKTGTFIGSKKR